MATNVSNLQSLLPTTTTQTTQYDPLLMGTLTDVLNAARREVNRPYQAYQDPRFASMTPDELRANQSVRDTYMGTQPIYNEAVQTMGAGTQLLNRTVGNAATWTPQAAQQYMNPYISNVVDAQTRNMLNNTAIERNRLRANAAGAGAFGGGRQFVAEQQLFDDQNRRLDETTSDLLMRGYDNAFDQFSKDRAFALDANAAYGTNAGRMADLATSQQNARNADIDKLSQVGTNLRDFAQRGLDYDYSNFVNQRDYNKNQIGWLSDMLNGASISNFQTGSTTTNSTASRPTGSNLTSQILTGLGAFGNFAQSDLGKSAGSWISSLFKANGGLVSKYAEGGQVKKYAEGGLTDVPFRTLMQQLQGAQGNWNPQERAAIEAEVARRRAMMMAGPPQNITASPITPSPVGPLGVPGFAGGMYNPAQEMVPVVDVGVNPIQQPRSMSEVLDGELAAIDAPTQQQPSAGDGITLGDLFSYQGGAFDALMQPNPMLLTGLNMMAAGDVNDPATWNAAAALDAMNSYEDMRSGRINSDVQRGTAIANVLTTNQNRRAEEKANKDRLDLEREKIRIQDERMKAYTESVAAKIARDAQVRPASAAAADRLLLQFNKEMADATDDPLMQDAIINRYKPQFDSLGYNLPTPEDDLTIDGDLNIPY